MVQCLPAKRETQLRFLGREDPLEKEAATHSSILVWGIPRTEKPGRLQSTGSQELDTTGQLSTTTCSVSTALGASLFKSLSQKLAVATLDNAGRTI